MDVKKKKKGKKRMTPDFWVGVDGVDFCSDAHWKIFSTTELTSVITV